MKQTLLRTYPLLLIINLSFSYNIPSADFIIYPKGFSINIPDDEGIEIFFFYGSVDKVTCNFQTDGIIMSTTKSNGEKWLLENTEVSLTPGQIILYWMYVKKNGVGYTKFDNFYNVTDIFPYNAPDPTVVQPDTISLQATGVSTNNRLGSGRPGTTSLIENLVPFTQPSPTSKRPILNLDPYYIPKDTATTSNLRPLKFPFTQNTESPTQHRNTFTHYLNTSDIVESNCTQEQETNSQVIGSNQDNSGELYDKCKPKSTSSKFNPGLPPEGLHPKWSGHHSEQSTTQPPKIRPTDTWYWNRK